MSFPSDGRRPTSRFAADDADVIVVIGSGAGGGTLATELCRKGAKVVLDSLFDFPERIRLTVAAPTAPPGVPALPRENPGGQA